MYDEASDQVRVHDIERGPQLVTFDLDSLKVVWALADYIEGPIGQGAGIKNLPEYPYEKHWRYYFTGRWKLVGDAQSPTLMVEILLDWEEPQYVKSKKILDRMLGIQKVGNRIPRRSLVWIKEEHIHVNLMDNQVFGEVVDHLKDFVHAVDNEEFYYQKSREEFEELQAKIGNLEKR